MLYGRLLILPLNVSNLQTWWPPWHTLIDIPYIGQYIALQMPGPVVSWLSPLEILSPVLSYDMLTCEGESISKVISIWFNHHKNVQDYCPLTFYLKLKSFRLEMSSENKPPLSNPIKYFHISWKLLFIYSLGFINSLPVTSSNPFSLYKRKLFDHIMLTWRKGRRKVKKSGGYC